MNNGRKKNIVVFILFLAILGFAIIKTINYRKLSRTGVKVEAEIFPGNYYITWQYVVNGKRYELKRSRSEYLGAILGEKYYAYYDPEDPATSNILFTEPVIEPSAFDTTTSLPLTIDCNKGRELVSFSYIVNGDTIKREHYYKFKNSFKAYKQKFTVYVKSDNPNIGYIKFEK